jgi:hypothetical protein
MKEYLYISRRKIDALASQYRRPRLPNLRFSLGLPGGRVSMEAVGGHGNVSLVKRTREVAEVLRRKGYLRDLPSEGPLDESVYLIDTSHWRHGLFSFGGDFSLEDGSGRVLTFVLWRPWNDGLLLLAGSPENVLGEQTERDGIWAYGTSGTWDAVLHFAEAVLSPGLSASRQASVPSEMWKAVRGRVFPAGERPGSEEREVFPPELLVCPRGVALAVMCLRFLSGLQSSSVETAFRVVERLPVSNRSNPPEWVVKALAVGAGGSDRLRSFQRCQAVYIGTPLYVAEPLVRDR